MTHDPAIANRLKGVRDAHADIWRLRSFLFIDAPRRCLSAAFVSSPSWIP